MKEKLPDGWEWKRLDDITTNYDGMRIPIKKEDRHSIQGIYPYYGASGIIDYVNDYIFDGEYLLIGEDGANLLARSTQIAFKASGKFWVNNHAHILKPSENVFLSFLSYYINSIDLQKYVTGTAQPKLTQKSMNTINIPLPPLDVQQKIVSILEKAEETKRLRAQADELTQQLLKSVFLEMFGDPLYNHNCFKVGNIADLIVDTQYGTSKKANENGVGIPILRMNNIDYNGNWNFSSLKHIEFSDEEMNKYLVHKGELLFNRTNSKELVGKCAVYREEAPMAFAGYLVKIKTDSRATSEFISAHLNSQYGKDYLCNMAKNIVGMANINAKEVQRIPILIPPLELREEFCSIVDQVEKTRQQQAQSSQQINILFDSLMQKAFTGELVS